MSDETFTSRLPHDAAYWDALGDRVMVAAVDALDEHYARRGAWWSALAVSGPALLGVSLLVAIGSVALIPDRLPGTPLVQEAMLPADALAEDLLASTGPPRVEALLGATRSGEGGRR